MFSLPNILRARALVSSVLPTPVGPKNINEPIGLFLSLSPTLALLIALARTSIASSCPITLAFKSLSRFFSFSVSVSVSFVAGIFVQLDTTAHISSLPIDTWDSFSCFFHFSSSALILSFSSFSWSRILAAFSKFWETIASSFSFAISSSFFSNFLKLSGLVKLLIFALEHASSIKSIALSGKNLSVIYLSDKTVASSIASSVILTLWCASYLSLSPLRILTVSSTEGSSTITLWNLLSKALSFSIYFLYSFKVVAPITCISPRDSNGLSIFAASIAPSALPAPTIVCISSINSITFLAFLISFKAFFNLSSNSPLYFAPAIIEAISKDTTLLPLSISGTFPSTIIWASPSTTAVLPTPGSPINTGLFLVLLLNISITLSISFSLPITGSSFPCLASSDKSLPNWFNVGVELLPLLSKFAGS